MGQQTTARIDAWQRRAGITPAPLLDAPVDICWTPEYAIGAGYATAYDLRGVPPPYRGLEVDRDRDRETNEDETTYQYEQRDARLKRRNQKNKQVGSV